MLPRLSVKRKLDEAISNGTAPHTSRGQRTIVRFPGGYATLANGSELTAAGRYWYGKVPGKLPKTNPYREDAEGSSWMMIKGKKATVEKNDDR